MINRGNQHPESSFYEIQQSSYFGASTFRTWYILGHLFLDIFIIFGYFCMIYCCEGSSSTIQVKPYNLFWLQKLLNLFEVLVLSNFYLYRLSTRHYGIWVKECFQLFFFWSFLIVFFRLVSGGNVVTISVLSSGASLHPFIHSSAPPSPHSPIKPIITDSDRCRFWPSLDRNCKWRGWLWLLTSDLRRDNLRTA